MGNVVSKYKDINELVVMLEGYHLLHWLQSKHELEHEITSKLADDITNITHIIKRRHSLFSRLEMHSMFILTLLAVVMFFIVPPVGILILATEGFMVFGHICHQIGFFLGEKDLNLFVNPDLLLELGTYYKNNHVPELSNNQQPIRVYNEVSNIIKRKDPTSPIAKLFAEHLSDPEPRLEKDISESNDPTKNDSGFMHGTLFNKVDKIPANTGRETREYGQQVQIT